MQLCERGGIHLGSRGALRALGLSKLLPARRAQAAQCGLVLCRTPTTLRAHSDELHSDICARTEPQTSKQWYVFYFLQTSATAPLGAVPARALTAATMEGRLQQVVSAIEEMSSRGELSKLLAHLQAQEEVLIQAMPQLDDLLPVLNPAMHTLGMVFILHCKAAAVPLSNLQAVNTFLSQCRTVLLGGDPEQIRTIPKEFVAVRHLPPRRRARLSHLPHGRFGPLPPPPLRRTPAGVHPWPAPPGRCPRPDRDGASRLASRLRPRRPPPDSSGVQQVLGGCDRHQVAARRRAPSDGGGRGAAARADSLHATPR